MINNFEQFLHFLESRYYNTINNFMSGEYYLYGYTLYDAKKAVCTNQQWMEQVLQETEGKVLIYDTRILKTVKIKQIAFQIYNVDVPSLNKLLKLHHIKNQIKLDNINNVQRINMLCLALIKEVFKKYLSKVIKVAGVLNIYQQFDILFNDNTNNFDIKPTILN